ncbi:MAG: sulfite exporter TauE/SafE family protein [Chloroflexi bacterium]|nr:sulfite exporter TauE/SafE family protein [Chloroflexota bacterium]
MNGRQTVVALAVGAGAGMLGGLMGVGGGIIMVPLMVGYLGLSQHQAHGTSLTAMILLALVAALTYAGQGYVHWTLAGQLALGSVLGVIIGAKVMMKVPSKTLRRGFGVFVIIVALRMLIGSI